MMKKKFMLLIVACFAVVVMVNVKFGEKKSFASHFTLANIEAIAMTADEFAELGCECAEPDQECVGNDGHTYTCATRI